ncbi:DUF1744-domain-containing protein, partial [Aureobasidium melanogenum]
MHKINVLHNPIIEHGLQDLGQEGADLPLHDSVECLIFSLDDLCTSLSAIVELIVPDQCNDLSYKKEPGFSIQRTKCWTMTSAMPPPYDMGDVFNAFFVRRRYRQTHRVTALSIVQYGGTQNSVDGKILDTKVNAHRRRGYHLSRSQHGLDVKRRQSLVIFIRLQRQHGQILQDWQIVSEQTRLLRLDDDHQRTSLFLLNLLDGVANFLECSLLSGDVDGLEMDAFLILKDILPLLAIVFFKLLGEHVLIDAIDVGHALVSTRSVENNNLSLFLGRAEQGKDLALSSNDMVEVEIAHGSRRKIGLLGRHDTCLLLIEGTSAAELQNCSDVQRTKALTSPGLSPSQSCKICQVEFVVDSPLTEKLASSLTSLLLNLPLLLLVLKPAFIVFCDGRHVRRQAIVRATFDTIALFGTVNDDEPKSSRSPTILPLTALMSAASKGFFWNRSVIFFCLNTSSLILILRSSQAAGIAQSMTVRGSMSPGSSFIHFLSGNGSRLLRAILLECLGHTLIFTNEVDKLLISQSCTVRVQYIQPSRSTLKEEFEDLCLEDLDQLELTTTFDFETFQFGKTSIMVKYSITLLQVLVFFLGGRQDHSPIWTIDFEEDSVVTMCLVAEGLRLECKVLGEGRRKNTPDTISVEFERSSNAFDKLTCHLNDARASQTETVQNDLVSNTSFLQVFCFALPDLLLTLEVISSVTEIFDSVDIEGVLALTNDGLFLDGLGFVDLVIDFLATSLGNLEPNCSLSCLGTFHSPKRDESCCTRHVLQVCIHLSMTMVTFYRKSFQFIDCSWIYSEVARNFLTREDVLPRKILAVLDACSQHLTKRTSTLSQHIIWMNVFHVEVSLWSFLGVWCHEFRIQLIRIVAKFGHSDGFETSTSLRQITMSSLFLRKPISWYMSMPWILALASTYGQSKKSPLYVTMMVGRASLMQSKNRSSKALSSGSLKIKKGPSYSGLGVYSKSAISSETISRFHQET